MGCQSSTELNLSCSWIFSLRGLDNILKILMQLIEDVSVHLLAVVIYRGNLRRKGAKQSPAQFLPALPSAYPDILLA